MLLESRAQRIPPLEIRVLGGFDVRVDDHPLPPLRSRREQWLLALLVLRHARDTPRDWLATTLWPDNDAAQALHYLRRSLSNLRQALGAAAPRLLSPTPRTVRLDLTDAFVDVVAFDSALAQASRSATPISAVKEAVELYRGPLLPDCPEEWALAERNQREQTYLTALETLATLSREQGDPTASVHWLRLLVSHDPYRESAYVALMQALADCGDQAAITSVYQDLRLLLRRDLNTAPSPQTEALYQQLRRQEKAAVIVPPVAAGAPATRRHLPVPLSDLIGREEEIAEILAWMKRRRLVTLIGTGGIGKTRLAIAVAEAALSRFEQGVWFVDLAPLSDASLTPNAAAKALGISEQRGKPLIDTLTEALAPRSLLLVLDNCEHLAEACAQLAHHLLSACPNLCIVATSRQALNVAGEQIYQIPALPLPPLAPSGQDAAAPQDKDPHVLMEYEAIRLFVDRAVHVSNAFRLNRRNAPAVVEICRQLDGIPLAIEMAAARMRSLSASEIQVRLSDRFHLLTSGNRGALPRQQTLRAAIDWSYNQLTDAERLLFNRLSVFAGGWTLEAAEQICSAEDVLDLLTSLVDRSLVWRREGEDEVVRYGMLETIRQYGLERLEVSGERTEIQRRHLDFYLHLAEQSVARGAHAGSSDRIARLEEEHDNLRAALEGSVHSSGEVALRLCGALQTFWRTRGYLAEGREWCKRALEMVDHQAWTQERANVFDGMGMIANLQGDYAFARTYHEESLSLYRELGDRNGIANALNGLGNVASNRSESVAARAYYEESLALRRELGDRSGIGAALHNLGNVARNQGDNATAQSYYEESLILFRETGNKQNIANALNGLGNVASHRNDYVRAKAYYAEALILFRELGVTKGIADALICLGNTAYNQGDAVSAQTYYEESLPIYQEIGDRSGMGVALNCLGDVALVQGDITAARDYYIESAMLFREIGHRRFLATSLNGLGNVLLKQEDIRSARTYFTESLVIQSEIGDRYGISVSLEALADIAARHSRWEQAAVLWGAAEAMQIAMGRLGLETDRNANPSKVSEARSACGEEAFQQAWERGAVMPMEQAIAYALQSL